MRIRRPRGLTNGHIIVSVVCGVLGGVYIWQPIFAKYAVTTNQQSSTESTTPNKTE